MGPNMICDTLSKICKTRKKLLKNMNSCTTHVRIQLSNQQSRPQNAKKNLQRKPHKQSSSLLEFSREKPARSWDYSMFNRNFLLSLQNFIDFSSQATLNCNCSSIFLNSYLSPTFFLFLAFYKRQAFTTEKAVILQAKISIFSDWKNLLF